MRGELRVPSTGAKTDPDQLRRARDRLGRLWGTNHLGALFHHDTPKVVLPWPWARRHPGGRLFHRESLEAEFAHQTPTIALVDPRTLWATQPWITRAGVDHYLGTVWFRTGRTYADQHKPFNRLPVVERRADGTDVILGGHHRSCAALLQGRLLLARCTTQPERRASTERVDLRLPSLAVGSWSLVPDFSTVEVAAEAIGAGVAARVRTETDAAEVIALLSDNPAPPPTRRTT